MRYRPRIFGIVFDFIHDLGWRPYLRYLKQRKIFPTEIGELIFVCDQSDRAMLEGALRALQASDSRIFDFIKTSRSLAFIMRGGFPEYSRVANLKLLVPRNTIDHGVDGILSILLFGYVLELERRKRGTLSFRLFPPNMDEIRLIWIDRLERLGIDKKIIEFYKATPLQRI